MYCEANLPSDFAAHIIDTEQGCNVVFISIWLTGELKLSAAKFWKPFERQPFLYPQLENKRIRAQSLTRPGLVLPAFGYCILLLLVPKMVLTLCNLLWWCFIHNMSANICIERRLHWLWTKRRTMLYWERWRGGQYNGSKGAVWWLLCLVWGVLGVWDGAFSMERELSHSCDKKQLRGTRDTNFNKAYLWHLQWARCCVWS